MESEVDTPSVGDDGEMSGASFLGDREREDEFPVKGALGGSRPMVGRRWCVEDAMDGLQKSELVSELVNGIKHTQKCRNHVVLTGMECQEQRAGA